jgi:hypothetical protein
MKKVLLAIVAAFGTVGVAYAVEPQAVTSVVEACCDVLAACCQGGDCC